MKDAEEEKEEKSGAIGTIARTHVGLEDNHSTASSFAVALGNSSWSDLPSPSSWNIDILVDSIKQLDPFPLKAICGSVWKNIEGQISFLKYAVSAPPEAFTFAHSARQLAYVDAIYGHKLQLGHANHAWLCLDLLDVLCQIAEAGYAGSVRAILEYPLKYCPEVLLLAMAHINTVYNLLQSEVSLAVFPMIMKNAGGVGMILYLWHVNPILVLRGFVDAAGLDPDCMTRILDICEELKVRDSRKFLLIHPLGFFYALYCSDTPTLLVFVFSPLNG
ncbi:uncharacterized protein LOC115684386 isoform X2 [Syzygium oleosum]|uniref:uncharacterized protein LOC115684386 isoform X2 n=1 Tax=Syzygium oleosum TaxID=219896 RepID=UPI0024B8D282|nr:uncharacterized protein LOC115684386 isoform X2 [Syzygium oleosum]